ncbi:MAG TPA: hypothetical protein VEJ38_12945 [Candidatus Acidoferrales bacterium]|nr:hypothetical protein [Candidatus Acidoferrales bacterium]
MRKVMIGFVVLLVVGAILYFRFRSSRAPIGVAYAGNRDVTLWSSTAQVREAVAMLKYGDRLEILQRSQDEVQVRTAKKVIGWTEESNLLSADVWEKARDLEARAAVSPVEARGHTHAISNLRVDAGRDSPRIQQLSKAVPLELYARAVVNAPAPAAPAQSTAANAPPAPEAAPPEVKKEDWWLVRARLPDQATVSGWILSRFVDLDVPAPLPDYASSAGMRIVAWFELARVADTPGTTRPQFLVVGSRGPEGQPCDFTLMRVYTWGKQRERYETAYVESNLCGTLPVKVTQAATPRSDVTFSFQDSSGGSAETRAYVMHQTVVKRVREPGSSPSRRKNAHG